jgi:Flp pilus assembly pilin Flp
MPFVQFISKFHREESGQDLVEYALVLVAIATGVLTGSSSLATDFSNWMATLNTKINSLI